MNELLQGTVIFLFTDIEGSTRLLEELGTGYVDALAEHRRIVRAACDRQAGVEVDTQGDASFIAFADARAAAAAASEAQGELASPATATATRRSSSRCRARSSRPASAEGRAMSLDEAVQLALS